MSQAFQHATPCHEVVAQLWEYLDGEVNDETRAKIREHLDECVHCRDHFTFEGALVRSITRVIDQPVETNLLRARILAALHEEGYGEKP